jgi:uncharacterized cupin superfamily protein
MSDVQKPHPLIRADAIKQMQEHSFSHPWNNNSEIKGVFLGSAVGLQRMGINLAFIYHSHQFEEEFIYIISGRGIAEIDDEEFEVGAGDFMGFPTPSVGHHLRNPFDENLVYLLGGERREMEIADFPHLQKRMFRNGQEVQISEWDELKPME